MLKKARIGRKTRDRYPYRSLIAKIVQRAYMDEMSGMNVGWEAIPWTDKLDVSISRVKRRAMNERTTDAEEDW